jgi:hypothetical protein
MGRDRIMGVTSEVDRRRRSGGSGSPPGRPRRRSSGSRSAGGFSKQLPRRRGRRRAGAVTEAAEVGFFARMLGGKARALRFLRGIGGLGEGAAIMAGLNLASDSRPLSQVRQLELGLARARLRALPGIDVEERAAEMGIPGVGYTAVTGQQLPEAMKQAIREGMKVRSSTARSRPRTGRSSPTSSSRASRRARRGIERQPVRHVPHREAAAVVTAIIGAEPAGPRRRLRRLGADRQGAPEGADRVAGHRAAPRRRPADPRRQARRARRCRRQRRPRRLRRVRPRDARADGAAPRRSGAEPPIVTAIGPVPHASSVRWVIESFDWDANPLYSSSGFLVRQAVAVHLLEYVRDTDLADINAAAVTRKKAHGELGVSDQESGRQHEPGAEVEGLHRQARRHALVDRRARPRQLQALHRDRRRERDQPRRRPSRRPAS